MLRHLTFAILIVLILFSNSVYAEKPDSTFLNNQWKGFKSPFTTDAKYVMLSGTLTVVTLLTFEDSVVDSTQEEFQEYPLGKTANDIGDLSGKAIPNLAYILGFGGYSLFAKDAQSKDRAVKMIEATAYSGIFSTALKYIIREPRPNHPHERESFPSGHSACVFAFATVVATEHEWYWAGLAYSLAALTAYQRINDNRHYLHDVVAGATIGISYGLGVHYLAAEKPKQTFWQLNPVDNGLIISRTSFF